MTPSCRSPLTVSLLVGACLLTLAGCPDEPQPPPSPTSAELPPISPSVPRGILPREEDRPVTHEEALANLAKLPTRRITVGDHSIEVWVAQTDAARETGLMHIRELKEDQGMLFIYPRADYLSFWMKNTYVPLSLAYISEDGRIEKFHDMLPLDEGPRYPSDSLVRYVLEVRRGWFERRGLEVGETVTGLR